ncbi:MAG: hypothetical protein V4472_04275 [Pseudomonadota bacterium]
MTQPSSYTAPHDVYTGGVLYRPGQPFTTSEPRGAAWQRCSAPAPRDVGDAKLEAMTITELKRHAAARGIEVSDIGSKALLLARIRSAREPVT